MLPSCDTSAYHGGMRVVYLAAGAGGMYCGSCLRDNRLAATLIAQGRDIILVPLYTPLRTDEAPVATGRIYYGGINVFLQQWSRLFRLMPTFMDRILNAPALIRRVARGAGGTRPETLGALTTSVLRGAHGAQRKELDHLVAGLGDLKPDLINLPNLMFLGVAEPLKTALRVPVLCTLSGEDVFIDRLPQPYRAEVIQLIRRHAAHVDGFIAVTRYYSERAVEHFGLPADRMHYVPMGVQVQPSTGERPPHEGPFTIGYLARICPDKGLHTLAQAFAILRQAGRKCRLRVAGYLARGERPYLQSILKKAEAAGIADSIEVVGEVDREGKLRFLRSLDVLSVPATYPEAKGFYVLEALACGVPVVQPRQGSYPELIEQTGGGLLCDPDRPQSIADALARLMDDPSMREALGRRGQTAVAEEFTADIMADRTWALYERFVQETRY